MRKYGRIGDRKGRWGGGYRTGIRADGNNEHGGGRKW